MVLDNNSGDRPAPSGDTPKYELLTGQPLVLWSEHAIRLFGKRGSDEIVFLAIDRVCRARMVIYGITFTKLEFSDHVGAIYTYRGKGLRIAFFCRLEKNNVL